MQINYKLCYFMYEPLHNFFQVVQLKKVVYLLMFILLFLAYLLFRTPLLNEVKVGY